MCIGLRNQMSISIVDINSGIRSFQVSSKYDVLKRQSHEVLNQKQGRTGGGTHTRQRQRSERAQARAPWATPWVAKRASRRRPRPRPRTPGAPHPEPQRPPPYRTRARARGAWPAAHADAPRLRPIAAASAREKKAAPEGVENRRLAAGWRWWRVLFRRSPIQVSRVVGLVHSSPWTPNKTLAFLRWWAFRSRPRAKISRSTLPRRRRRDRDGGSPPAPRSPLVGEPGTHPLFLPCFVLIGAGVIPPAPALLLRGGVDRCLACFDPKRCHGPVPHP